MLEVMNTKEEKFAFLGSHLKSLPSDQGVFHIRRKRAYLNKKELQNFVLVDLYFLRKYFPEVSRSHAKFGVDEDGRYSWFSMTLRLENNTIVSYLISTGEDEKNSLRMDYSAKGSVIEYDDTCHRPIFQTGKEHLADEALLHIPERDLALFQSTELMTEHLFIQEDTP